MTAYTFIYLMSIHWVADFVMQTDWQANNKSKNWGALAEHTFTYSLVMLAGLWWWMFFTDSFPAPTQQHILIWFTAITFTTHFVTDAITSRINSALWAKGNTHDFFVSVGFDQLIHYLTLFFTLKALSIPI